MYGKASGVFFKQYVQSFKPDCGATPQQIHAIGVELAKEFDGFEVVVATHIDRDHWHNHFVVNTVNCETGRKIQIGKKELLQTELRSMMSNLKARDQASWKQKLRWMLIGAVLSSVVYALLLILL